MNAEAKIRREGPEKTELDVVAEGESRRTQPLIKTAVKKEMEEGQKKVSAMEDRLASTLDAVSSSMARLEQHMARHWAEEPEEPDSTDASASSRKWLQQEVAKAEKNSPPEKNPKLEPEPGWQPFQSTPSPEMSPKKSPMKSPLRLKTAGDPECGV